MLSEIRDRVRTKPPAPAPRAMPRWQLELRRWEHGVAIAKNHFATHITEVSRQLSLLTNMTQSDVSAPLLRQKIVAIDRGLAKIDAMQNEYGAALPAIHDALVICALDKMRRRRIEQAQQQREPQPMVSDSQRELDGIVQRLAIDQRTFEAFLNSVNRRDPRFERTLHVRMKDGIQRVVQMTGDDPSLRINDAGVVAWADRVRKLEDGETQIEKG